MPISQTSQPWASFKSEHFGRTVWESLWKTRASTRKILSLHRRFEFTNIKTEQPNFRNFGSEGSCQKGWMEVPIRFEHANTKIDEREQVVEAKG